MTPPQSPYNVQKKIQKVQIHRKFVKKGGKLKNFDFFSSPLLITVNS